MHLQRDGEPLPTWQAARNLSCTASGYRRDRGRCVGVVVIGGALATVLVGDAFLGATAAARNDREHDTRAYDT